MDKIAICFICIIITIIVGAITCELGYRSGYNRGEFDGFWRGIETYGEIKGVHLTTEGKED